MIVIHKKLRHVVPYHLIYWPRDQVLRQFADHLPLSHYARLESASTVDQGRRIVGHYVGLTLVIDLQRPLASIYKDLIALFKS